MALPAELETLDTASLAAKLDEIQRNNEYLKKENATLESYLHRHVTRQKNGQMKMLEEVAKAKGRSTGRQP